MSNPTNGDFPLLSFDIPSVEKKRENKKKKILIIAFKFLNPLPNKQCFL